MQGQRSRWLSTEVNCALEVKTEVASGLSGESGPKVLLEIEIKKELVWCGAAMHTYRTYHSSIE